MIKHKMAKMSGLLWVVVLLVGAYFFIPPFQGMVNGLFKGGDTTTPVTPGTGACYIEDTTLTVGPAEEMYNPTTKVTTSYHRVIVNGVDQGRYADSATLTVNPKDEVEIIWAENTSQAANAGYYAAKQSFTVPCVGAVMAGAQKDSGAYKLFASDATNMTRRIFNEDNGNLNSITDNETLGAGDQVTLDISFIGTYKDAFSPYGPIVIVAEANDTSYKDFDLSFTGVTCVKTDVPGQHSVASVDNKAWAFSCAKDGRGIRSNERWDGGLSIEVETSVNPTSTGGDVIRLHLFDSDYYLNSETGKEELGVENSDDDDVGVANPLTIIYVK